MATSVIEKTHIGTKGYKSSGITSPFTATHRGFLYFSILIKENSNVSMSINGNNVINIGDYWTGNVTEVVIPYTLYVDAGDVVAWTINGSAALNYIRYVY